MELLFRVQIGGIFELFVEEIGLARIVLSCHFALDVLCDKEGAHDSSEHFIGHHCLMFHDGLQLSVLHQHVLARSVDALEIWASGTFATRRSS